MRRPLSLTMPLALIACGGACVAHEEAQELGHHWQSHAYSGEMHFQIFLIIALGAAAAMHLWAAKRRVKR